MVMEKSIIMNYALVLVALVFEVVLRVVVAAAEAIVEVRKPVWSGFRRSSSNLKMAWDQCRIWPPIISFPIKGRR